jgi:hypothetical protein
LPDASAPPRPPGCLIARSCAEAAELSAAGQTAALAAAAGQREIFLTILRDGMRNGELPHDADIDALAWHYLGVHQAILHFPSTGADLDTLNRMIDVALSAWPANEGAAQR